MKAALVLAALLVALPLLPVAPAAEAAPKPIRIAVIDTGINASHPEFRPGQVVAWRDFTAEASPVPRDGHGHGTATASLVAGLNVGACVSAPKLSFAPGADLIIARVGTDSGAVTGNLAAAFDWAVAEGADVISMSIGGTVPLPGIGFDAARRAREAGVLVVVSAGNGLANAGAVPYPSWTTTYGNSHHVISVGAATRLGSATTVGNLDPDVSSWGRSACVARAAGGYATMTGTSFAAPFVAGLAAKGIETARANGHATDPDAMERLVVLSATNAANTPYALQGMGFLLDKEAPRVLAHAAAGTLPDYDAQGAHAVADREYRDRVVKPLRSVI